MLFFFKVQQELWESGMTMEQVWAHPGPSAVSNSSFWFGLVWVFAVCQKLDGSGNFDLGGFFFWVHVSANWLCSSY